MLNVKQTIKGNKLILEIDLNEEYGLSKSGKTTIIASSQGNVTVKDDIKVGINVYKSAKVGVK